MAALMHHIPTGTPRGFLVGTAFGIGLSCMVGLWLAPSFKTESGPVVYSFSTVQPAAHSSEASTSTIAKGSTPRSAWKALARGEYRQALSELRAGGIPETVIADIFAGAVTRQYAPRLLALRRSPWRFWEPVQRRQSNSTEAELQLEKQARELESERNSVMREFLGMDWAGFERNVSGKPDPLERVMEGFSTGGRSNARPILAKYDALERDVIQRAGGTVGLPERAELNRLYAEKLEQLRNVISPQEIEEYEIRTSVGAENMRQLSLVGFDPTEEEFRAIYRVRRAFDDPSGELPGESQPAEARLPTWQAHQAMQEELRAILGEERYGDYCRSQDYTYRGLIELTDQFGLPKSCAVQIHDYRESFLLELRAIREQESISPEQRKAGFDQIYRRAKDSVKHVLGEAAYRRYSQLDIGGWMTQLESN